VAGGNPVLKGEWKNRSSGRLREEDSALTAGGNVPFFFGTRRSTRPQTDIFFVLELGSTGGGGVGFKE